METTMAQSLVWDENHAECLGDGCEPVQNADVMVSLRHTGLETDGEAQTPIF